jgi:hypothetical protein
MTTSGSEDHTPSVTEVGWVNFELDESTHNRAKARAALTGKKLYPYLIGLIERGVAEDEEAAERERRERDASD